ncbi:RimJ/RimL family protein N-acetyltransferase [Actinoplanes tereljensis]|uniref:N-acetyltransferase n=1 Tax=Paractinoplanes tereljensis TaxID=571912 RepID=A0A919TW91_9ACTN|nr:GNAT family protein [Actinoplanes tereljensis]GIF22672.1 N-acetyltransferase [Actinoplanes tereljensis]
MPDEVFPRTDIVTTRLRLRAFGARDAADVHEAWQDELFGRTASVGYLFAGADLETAAGWCTGAEKRRQDGLGVELAIEPRDGGRLLGHVALFGVNWSIRIAEVHYWTAPWARGNGYAGEAARAVAEWALRDVAFERISLRAAVDNIASRRVADAAGFHFEGVQRSVFPARDGGRLDLAVYSLIRPDLEPSPA